MNRAEVTIPSVREGKGWFGGRRPRAGEHNVQQRYRVKPSPCSEGMPCFVVNRVSKKMRVFRCRKSLFFDDGRIDANLHKIIRLMDGKKSLASIAFASGMNMSEFQKSVRRLIDLGLIVPVDEIEIKVPD